MLLAFTDQLAVGKALCTVVHEPGKLSLLNIIAVAHGQRGAGERYAYGVLKAHRFQFGF